MSALGWAWASDARDSARVVLVVQKAKKKARRPVAKKEADPAEAATPAPAATAASGEMKFSRDIAPILVNNCAGCHNPQQKRGKLDMSTFEKLMEGTPKEKVITPGNPDESHLVLRIKGEETPKMPQQANRSLSDAAIAKIESWVKAGAVLDAGIDPKAPMAKYATSVDDLRKLDLAKMSAEEREKQVETVGLDRWKKANSKVTPELANTTHFIMFSTLPKERAATTLRALETSYGQVKAIVGPKSVEWGEKASVFVFADRATFVEFVRSMENRDIEKSDNGSSKLSIPQPYIAVLDPTGGREEPAAAVPAPAPKKVRSKRGADDSGAGGGSNRSLAGVLTEQFAIGAAGLAGTPPRWVSLGLGAFLAKSIEPRASEFARLRREAYSLWDRGWQSKAQDALGDASSVGEVRAVGFAILDALSSGPGRAAIPGVVQGMLAGGEKLDDVIGKVLGMSREEFLGATGEFVGERYGRSR